MIVQRHLTTIRLILSLELKRESAENIKEGVSIKRKREFYIIVKSLEQIQMEISCHLFLTAACRKKRLQDETDASSNSSPKKIKSLMSREPRGAAVKFEGEFLPTKSVNVSFLFRRHL